MICRLDYCVCTYIQLFRLTGCVYLSIPLDYTSYMHMMNEQSLLAQINEVKSNELQREKGKKRAGKTEKNT